MKQFIPHGVCLTRQACCCRFNQADSIWLPHLLDEEIANLPAGFISDKKIKPILNPFAEGFICSFLNLQENICKIYPYRPFECQLYPFLLNRQDKKVFLAIDPNCPYIKQNLNTKELEEYTKYLVSFLNLPAQEKMVRNNPHIIQASYPKVLELIEIEYMRDF